MSDSDSDFDLPSLPPPVNVQATAQRVAPGAPRSAEQQHEPPEKTQVQQQQPKASPATIRRAPLGEPRNEPRTDPRLEPSARAEPRTLPISEPTTVRFQPETLEEKAQPHAPPPRNAWISPTPDVAHAPLSAPAATSGEQAPAKATATKSDVVEVRFQASTAGAEVPVPAKDATKTKFGLKRAFSRTFSSANGAALRKLKSAGRNVRALARISRGASKVKPEDMVNKRINESMEKYLEKIYETYSYASKRPSDALPLFIASPDSMPHLAWYGARGVVAEGVCA